MTLFDPGPALPPPPTLSADQRRTLRRRHLLDQGVHPTTRQPLAGNGQTCKTCAHLAVNAGHRKTYWKCGKTRLTSGPATDVNLSWPACTLWAPAEDR